MIKLWNRFKRNVKYITHHSHIPVWRGTNDWTEGMKNSLSVFFIPKWYVRIKNIYGPFFTIVLLENIFNVYWIYFYLRSRLPQ